ncbi:MAG: ABC transporter substrate-binding protein [Alphaproteobacteria bacterium]|nr:ABC transporter substrate-binding protein [Alphaproteobacteria bacterium]
MIARVLGLGAGAALLVAATLPAAAQQKVNFVLNWTPGGDHGPVYHAHKQGKYKEAGIDLAIETGRGSGFSAQKVGAGESQLGIVDMAVMLQARGKGADLVAVMALYANSPYGLYWKKSSGVKSAKDLAGKKLGNPPADAARAMWPAIAKAIGIPADSVTWVNIAPEAKVASLQSGAIDATTHFYNVHYVYERAFGPDMGFVAMRDIGFNPYGNAIVANGAFLKANKAAVEKFVRVTQRAYADCVANPTPCNQTLAEAASQKVEDVAENFRLVEVLMSNEATRTIALGWLDPKRVAEDVALVKATFNTPDMKAEDVATNDFLDKSIKMSK